VLVVGEEEARTGNYQLKYLASGEQQTMSQEDLIRQLKL
jgi:histidyl-tRNA synthetase